MSSFSSIAPTTELEAVNEILASIGEAPLATQADIDTPATPDVEMLVTTFKKHMRSCLAEGWRFNTELNYRINPTTSSFSWTDTDSTVQTLAIFEPPANLLDFAISLRADQQGSKYLDTVVRRSSQYTALSDTVLVFYDRAFNRDGFPALEREAIYIDPTWMLKFEDLPEIARQYITIRVARLFQKNTVGSSELEGFTREDLATAYRALKRQYGSNDDYNMLDNMDVAKHLGFRPRGASGYTDLRRGGLGLL